MLEFQFVLHILKNYFNKDEIMLHTSQIKNRLEMMDDFKKYTQELKDIFNNLRDNMREDVENYKNEILGLAKKLSSDHGQHEPEARKFVVTIPLPREIHVEENIKFINGAYHVTYNIKCGLRHFSTTVYLGDKADGDQLAIEMRRCIDTAVNACLEYDRGQVQEMCESGKVISIQSL